MNQNAPDSINHLKFFSESIPPNPLACVQLISLFIYESIVICYSEFSQIINQNASIVACHQFSYIDYLLYKKILVFVKKNRQQTNQYVYHHFSKCSAS